MKKTTILLVAIICLIVCLLLGMLTIKADDELTQESFNLPLLGQVESFDEKLNREISEKSSEDLVYFEITAVEETEDIDFKTEYVSDNDMYKDQSKVITDGVKGKELVKSIVKTKYVNNESEIVDKTIIDSAVIEEPVTRVIKVGTKERPSHTIKVFATMYDGCWYCQHGCLPGCKHTPQEHWCKYCNATCTGAWATERHTIAVDKKVIPYGTKVYLTFSKTPQYNGYYYAEDCGGAIKGNRIDVFFNGHNVNWANQTVIATW